MKNIGTLVFKYEYQVIGQKIPMKYEGRKPGLFVNYGQFPCSWIRIRISIPNTDPVH
jgi:hypothetical protein